MSFQGFESILEGLLGPELLEDLKLFKGKNLFHSDTSGHDHTCIWMAWMTILWFEHSLLSAHYDNTAALYYLVPLYSHSTRQPLAAEEKMPCVPTNWYFGWCGASVKVYSVLKTLL